MAFQVGDKAFYYGKLGHHNHAVVVTRVEDGPNGRVFIRPVGLAAAEQAVMPGELHPYRDLDDDVHRLTWAQLQDEVMKLRGYFRWILGQRGDDLCWRDFYVAAAACLPEGRDRHLAREALSSCHPRWVMLGNCDRFITSLKCDEPYATLGTPPLTGETAKRPPARGFDVFLRVHRGRPHDDEHWTAATFSPPEYVGSFRAQEMAHNCLTRLLASADHLERTGEHQNPDAWPTSKPDSSLTAPKG